VIVQFYIRVSVNWALDCFTLRQMLPNSAASSNVSK